MYATQALASVREKIIDLVDSLDDEASIEDIAEVGTILSAIVNMANTELNALKADLRTEALNALEFNPGTHVFDGVDVGHVTVVVPNPKVVFVKGTDPEVIKNRLGDDFDLYIETKVSYVPRKNSTELAARMATGQNRDLLLCSLKEAPQTPRVSFRKL